MTGIHNLTEALTLILSWCQDYMRSRKVSVIQNMAHLSRANILIGVSTILVSDFPESHCITTLVDCIVQVSKEYGMIEHKFPLSTQSSKYTRIHTCLAKHATNDAISFLGAGAGSPYIVFIM